MWAHWCDPMWCKAILTLVWQLPISQFPCKTFCVYCCGSSILLFALSLHYHYIVTFVQDTVQCNGVAAGYFISLFLSQQLSQDDFTVYGGVFGNKQNSAFKNLEVFSIVPVCLTIGPCHPYWSSHTSLWFLQAALQSPYASVTFPAVEGFGSSAVPALLQETLGVSPVLVDEDTLPELKLSSSVNNLLLIKLPYCSSDKPCRELLKHNGELKFSVWFVYFATHNSNIKLIILLNRWDYWACSEKSGSQKCSLHSNVHRTTAVSSKILSFVVVFQFV